MVTESDYTRFKFLLENIDNKEILFDREKFYDYKKSFCAISWNKKASLKLINNAKITIRSIRDNLLIKELRLSNKPRLDAKRFISNKEIRKYILRLYDNECLCCGGNKSLSLDHVIPVFLGGKNEIDNIQLLCRSCNSRKGINIIDYRN